MNLLIKSATIIDKSQPSLHLKKRDILIEKGLIQAIGVRIEAGKKTRVIELKNLHVSPGWFDSSVSFGEPGYEERETISNGLEVAASAGFTGIVLNTNTHPSPDTSGDIVFLKETGKGHSTSLYPMGTVSMGANGAELSEMYDMSLSGAVAFSDYKHALDNPNLLKLALLYTQNFDALVYSFPQDGQLSPKGQMHEGEVSMRLGLRGIPTLTEELRIARDLAILQYTGGKLHIPTISTASSVNLIAAAKKNGLDVSCSVAIHHLWFTDEVLDGFDSRYKTLPPLRGKKDSKALQKALAEGVIDFVTSDHCPLDVEEKRREFDQAAFGALGLEESFGVLNQIYGPEVASEILGRGRKRFGLAEAKLAAGQPAELTLFDPEAEYTLSRESLLSTSGNSMFLGIPLKGKAYGIIRGEKTSI
ncbi:dihydroorotase [Robiginitalea aurantiaca]|uniref:Dihydroorotase n=1 Tax=Robiginitalea aurantiaca TaxID=3056915 RepID=A0ABT7WFZ9_9FLAO|nr:dihydroorotase [Robiginitalea aurantiaca]MDM9631845.1 dihydroorotase [Robiginitalea aurantiaca]